MAQVVSVRFRGGQKNYYFDPRGIQAQPGDYLIVETAQGLDYVRCAEPNHEVPDDAVVHPLRPVVRVATDNDHKAAAYSRRREKEALGICEQKIAAHGLEMKLVSAKCSFEGNKIIFFFTAEGRVDFRELVRDLASVFRTRIELRQIGVRDEAKMLGGIGICGRALCCGEFLNEFVPVSIKMAKTQNLSLNPSIISGACGRLMCCLKYEQAAYEDAAKRMPKNESFVDTPDGLGNICSLNLLKEQVQVRLDSIPESPKWYKLSEINVLRNGKGSRDGIEIPKEHPVRAASDGAGSTTAEFRPRHRSDSAREALPMLSAVPDINEPMDEEEESRGRRRNRGKGGKSKLSSTEKMAKQERAIREGTVEKIPVRFTGDTSAEKKAAADRAAEQAARAERTVRGKDTVQSERSNSKAATQEQRPAKSKDNSQRECSCGKGGNSRRPFRRRPPQKG